MRWRYFEKTRLDGWERWFAWKPVPIGGYPIRDRTIMVWLEWVERKFIGFREGIAYNYRLPELTKASRSVMKRADL